MTTATKNDDDIGFFTIIFIIFMTILMGFNFAIRGILRRTRNFISRMKG